MKKKILLTYLFIVIFTAGCGPTNEILVVTMVAQTHEASTLAAPTPTPNPTPTPTLKPTATLTPEPTATLKSWSTTMTRRLAIDYGMTYFVMSGRWGYEFEDGSVISLLDKGDAYLVAYSAAITNEAVDAQKAINLMLDIVAALDYPESIFQRVMDDTAGDWVHYNTSPNFEERYQHDGYEVVIIQINDGSFNPTHPFNEGGFHVKLYLEKPTRHYLADLVEIFRDDFDGALAEGWSLLNEDPAAWMITADGQLQITASDASLLGTENGLSNLLLRNAPEGDFDILTWVVAAPSVNFQQAAIFIYEDEDNFVSVNKGFCGPCGGTGVYMDSEVDGDFLSFGVNRYPTSALGIYLRLAKRGNIYTSFFSFYGETWTEVAQTQRPLNPIKVGLGASNSDRAGLEGTLIAEYDFFAILESE